MLDLLPPVQELTNENEKRYNISWKGMLAVLVLYNENSMNLESISSKFTNVVNNKTKIQFFFMYNEPNNEFQSFTIVVQVNVISCRKDENSRSMMSSFVETFSQVISTIDKFGNGEYFFIGGWIDRYLHECPKNRSDALIKILLEIFEKCSRLETSRYDSGTITFCNAQLLLIN